MEYHKSVQACGMIPVHAAQSPRQACLEEVGRPERFPRSLLSVWGVTSRLVSAGEGDHAQSSTDPTSRGDGSHVLPAWWLCAGGTRVGPGSGWAARERDQRLR